MGEFEFIDSIRKQFSVPEGFTGIGDDCAIIPRGDGLETLVTKDMLVEGVHFLLERISAYDLGWKSAAVNISDIAAMGGTPVASFLSLALPSALIADGPWLNEFIRGYRDLSTRFSCPLLGGDTTSSPDGLCIDVTVLGSAPAGHSVKRSGALDGDLVCVSGYLGDSGAGLKLLLGSAHSASRACAGVGDGGSAGAYLIGKHCRPVPRVEAGLALASISGVHSMMDISDGIASDLRHILRASGLSALVECASLPFSKELLAVSKLHDWDPLELALTSGEDYELLFTISPESLGQVEQALKVCGCHCYIIGKCFSGAEPGHIEWSGTNRDFRGFRHF
ncbi:MAG: thiamine-phosphate kinase [Candidatus Cryptobacteroides sp.]|nr:thiamine-phosphate kinase [Candidatus Cryptobacteroides sp.]